MLINSILEISSVTKSASTHVKRHKKRRKRSNHHNESEYKDTQAQWKLSKFMRCIALDRMGLCLHFSCVCAMLDYLTLISRPFTIPIFYFSFALICVVLVRALFYPTRSFITTANIMCVRWQIVSSEICWTEFLCVSFGFWTHTRQTNSCAYKLLLYTFFLGLGAHATILLAHIYSEQTIKRFLFKQFALSCVTVCALHFCLSLPLVRPFTHTHTHRLSLIPCAPYLRLKLICDI